MISCKKCHYAIWDGDTQVGCQMGRTKKFEERGELIEAKDDDKNFYLINRHCNAYNEWTTLEPSEASKRLRLPYGAIITGTEEQIRASLDFNVDIPPEKVLIGSYDFATYDYPFTHFLEPMSDDEQEYFLAKQLKCEFYVLLRGQKLSNLFINTCDYLYNEALQTFVMIEGKHTLKLSKSILLAGPNSETLKKEFSELCLRV